MMTKKCEVGSALHRNRMEIMENILRVANGGAGKTRIMYRCNLSYEQLHVYLDRLVLMGLLQSIPPRIDEKNNLNTYETTNKGQAFIQAYRNLTDLLAI